VKAKELALGEDSAKLTNPAPVPKSTLSTMYRGLSSLFSVNMSTKSEGSQRTETGPSTVCASRASVEFTESMKSAMQQSVTDSSDSSKARETQDFARQILNRLKELPEICEEPFGNENPAEIPVPTPIENHNPTPDQTSPEYQHKAVTPEELKAYLVAQNDNEVRARIPFRQHPRLTPPKCVAHLAVRACRSASSSLNIDLSEKVASSLGVPQIKPTVKPVIPLLNLTFVTSGSIGVNEAPAKRFSFINMFYSGSSRVGVAPA